MASVMVESAPCHGAAIQADDCCITAPAAEAVELAPAIGALAPAAERGAPAPCVQSVGGGSATQVDPGTTPLYRLFRALLI